ncbi:hypothetical protein Adt_04427 [Abeliophyllum distichum]|uniref:DUF4228 domain-containing protein n=1 Tax=Abeliophyllum distichum TaxID=126358 RepID=A0ABD1W1A7_9LAMI
MGIKILNFQIIPHCFPLMGFRHFQSHHHHHHHGKRIIKLIKYDGTVKIYNRPLHVSEITEEFPKYMVCPSDSFYIGQKIPSLSVDEKLRLGQNYLLLPKQFFHSVFSFTLFLQCQTGCASLTKNVFLNKAASCQPFDIQKTPSGSLRIRVSEQFITQLIEQGKDDQDQDQQNIRVCTTPQLQKDYQQLVGQRQWKPKLDTISERHHKKKISIKTKKKLHNSHTSQLRL